MAKERTQVLLELAQQVMERAKAAGAEIAEALATENAELSAKVRMGAPELVQEAQSRGLGLRVFVDGREAIVTTSDTTADGLGNLVQDAVAMARLAQRDEMALPPAHTAVGSAAPALELYDKRSASFTADEAIRLAIRAEDAARAFDPRISNSEGSTCSRDAGARALVTSGGFEGAYQSSAFSIHVSPVAEDVGGKKQNGDEWEWRRFLADLPEPEEVGQAAGRRTIGKLGAGPVPTTEAPVIFDPEAASSLLSLFFSVISGSSIYRRTSYLLDREGTEVASPLVHISDDPLRLRAPGSRPFDGEGLASRKNEVVKAGRLETFLLDTYSARKLGRESTGSASRGLGARPGVAPSNFILEPGEFPPEALLGDVKRGLLVKNMMGFGFNAVTGDFSRGAEGFWIEDGQIARPVSGVTVSLNFDALWKSIDAIGNDLVLKRRYASPSFRVSNMTIAGAG